MSIMGDGRKLRIAAPVAAVSLAGVVACMSLVASPDRLLARSYADPSAVPGVIHLDDDGRRQPAGIARVADPVVEPAVTPAMGTGLLTSAPLSVGARIAITAASGQVRDLEVVDVAEFDGGRVGITGVRLQMVTLRDAATGAGTMRLLMAIDPAAPAKSAPFKL